GAGRDGVRRGREPVRRRLRAGRRDGRGSARRGRPPDRDSGQADDERLLRERRLGAALRDGVRARPARALRRRGEGFAAVGVATGELTRYERWSGRDEPPVERRRVAAGPLAAEVEAPDLRYVRAGDLELVRRLYAAVRDRNWGTVQP